MKLRRPLSHCVVTQPFGVNYVNFYQQLGMKGHNGIDFRCHNNIVYSSFDGTIKYAGKYSDGGIGMEIVSDYEDGDGRFKAIYYHLAKVNFTKGHILGGQPLGISDNTGKYTTGEHLHWGIKRCDSKGNTLNYNNGYHGAIDPEPYLEDNFYDLPVDERYGQAKYLTEEIKIKIKYPFLNKRELYAMVYGAYPYTEVINPALFPMWAFLRREQYLNGERPEINLIR